MTIPRQIGPESAVRAALPDYGRSTATVERMVSDLRRGRSARTAASVPIRALFPVAATRDTLVRAVIAAVLLGGSLLAVVAIVLLALGLDAGRSPGIALLIVLLALGGIALLLGLLGLRFAAVAWGTARSRVEISEEGLLVVGGFRSRRVLWRDIRAVESRVVHPVHWLTAALRLRDGTRVLMPAFDRHIWTWSQPSGQGIRALRTELHRERKASRARF